MTPEEIARASARFGEHAPLAARLLPHSVAAGDGAHDIAHILRVWKAADTIHSSEGGNREVLVAAVLLHDCVAVEKNAPDRNKASRLAAAQASRLLRDLGWDDARIEATGHAIAAHSFSAGIVPESIEAKILQDADRLDAIGMIGVARCFYIGGRLGSALYDPFDPEAEARAIDDKRYALDHFETKLLKLSAGFKTETGRAMASVRHARLLSFLDALASEI